jgi:hypothetical protein
VRKLFGPLGAGSASVTLSAGSQKNDLSRSQTIFVTGEGRSHYTTSYLQVGANLGYSFDMGQLYARPEIDGSVIGLKQHAFTEQGLEGLGVTGASDTEWITTVSPHLTLGMNINSTARFSLTGGGVFHNKDAISHPFRLIGSDPSSDPAMISTRFDKAAFMAGADLAVLGSSRVKFDLGYRGEFGRSVTSHTAHVDVRVAF